MREIQRTIVAALLFSKDGKLLMGRKDPAKGGVYSDCWHLPGGGVEENETLPQGVIREVNEEVGLDISPYQIKQLPYVGHGTAERITPETGEKVLCHMEFNRFEVNLDRAAEEITLHVADDLVDVQWFCKSELRNVKQIPGGMEFFIQAGYV